MTILAPTEEADGARQAGSRRAHKEGLVRVTTIRLNGFIPSLHRGPFGSTRAHKQGLVEITSIRLKPAPKSEKPGIVMVMV